ncbi:MAG: 30S ribosomal protein S6 [Anaerolineales bacterium]|nr:30S ribosomal protein S6 [Anaerolineales bacterium]
MRPYELVFIAHPDLEENAIKGLVEQVKAWITESGGVVNKVDIWGKRKLAYQIRKQSEGQYVLLHAEMDPDVSAKLEQNFRITEPILRFLITTVD